MSYVKETMLVKVSAQANNNKFYHVTLDKNGTITKRWGRVGTEGTSTTEHGPESRFDTVVRGKMSRGYKETDVITDVDGSTNDSQPDLGRVAHSVLASSSHKGNPIVDSLIDRLVSINRHQIMEASGGLITVDTNGVMKTPLGLISEKSINEATSILTKLTKVTPVNSAPLLEEYLRLVPQKVPSKRGWHEVFFDKNNTIEKQKDLLDQLKNSLAWYNTEREAAKQKLNPEVEPENLEEKYRNLFKYNIGLLEDDKEFARIEKFYNSTRNSMHRSVSGMRLQKVFTVTDPAGYAEYEKLKTSLKNEQELWHGTQSHNLLSVLRRGLIVPKSNSGIQITGRMFGDGVYLSDQSTKSLNYATSYWSGGRNSPSNSCFMLLNNVVMGNEYHPKGYYTTQDDNTAHSGKDWRGRPYNSISVKGGTAGVMNNEMIVWNLNQIKVRYICEFGF